MQLRTADDQLLPLEVTSWQAEEIVARLPSRAPGSLFVEIRLVVIPLRSEEVPFVVQDAVLPSDSTTP